MPKDNAAGWESLCGLVEEYGEIARSGEYEHKWQRPAEVWKAVQRALDDHESGKRATSAVAQPPRWLAPASKEQLRRLATNWSHREGFHQVRRLELAGLVELDADDEYILAAVGGIGGRFEKGRAQVLRDDPQLRERVVWRFFEVEGGGEVSLANIDKYTAAENGWQTAFQELVSDGTLPRDRVLDSALNALGRDFSAYRAGWYSRLIDALDPTIPELAERQPQLRDLLRSSNGATVSWALRYLKSLIKPKLIDAAATIPALIPAAQISAKTTALRAVKLAATLHASAPAAGDAERVATAGLGHPQADVQEAAAALLAVLGKADQLQTTAVDLAPRVRKQHALASESAPDKVSASHGKGSPPARPVRADGRDAVERLAALLEDASDPIEVELGLAAAAVLTDGTSLTALVKRAKKVWERGPREQVVAGWLRGHIAHLICALAGEQLAPPPAPPGAAAFLQARIAEIAPDAKGGPRRQLLATPTDSAGWLDPAVFAERLRTGQHSRLDLVQALLRLDESNRSDALAHLPADLEARIPAGCADLTRWALGGPEPTCKRRLVGRGRTAADLPVWIAAARGRDASASVPALAAAGARGPGRAEPVSVSLTFRGSEHTWTDSRGPHRYTTWHWSYDAGSTRRPDVDEPTAVSSREGARVGDFLEDYVPWLGLLWPHDTDWFAYTVGDAIIGGAVHDEVQHDAVPALQALGTHPGKVGALSATMLAAGLSGSRTERRVAAVDAVLQLSERGSLTPVLLAEGLRCFADPAQLKRWSGSLADLARSGDLGAELALQSTRLALPILDHDRRGLSDMLGVLLDIAIERGASLHPELRNWLEAFNGSSLTARTAKRLLSL